jgi:hypothetical protein
MWVKEVHEVRAAFDKWSGSKGQVWEYACGHGTLLVRVWAGSSKSLFLQCKDCRTVRFPSMGWKNVNLQLREKSNPAQNDEDFRFEVEDGERFYVACWGVYLLESEKPIYLDWPPESRKSSERWLLI